MKYEQPLVHAGSLKKKEEEEHNCKVDGHCSDYNEDGRECCFCGA